MEENRNAARRQMFSLAVEGNRLVPVWAVPAFRARVSGDGARGHGSPRADSHESHGAGLGPLGPRSWSRSWSRA